MLRVLLIALVVSQFLPPAAEAAVTRLHIERRQAVLNGRPFGAAGPYETLSGKVHFALDPALPQNAIIVDVKSSTSAGVVATTAPRWLVPLCFTVLRI